tara:strand:- start:1413 stop:1598 length:186 start_codon:yes stop_codon:yes gene_type:complete
MDDNTANKLIEALIDQTRAIDELVRIIDQQNIALHNTDENKEEAQGKTIKLMNGQVINIDR